MSITARTRTYESGNNVLFWILQDFTCDPKLGLTFGLDVFGGYEWPETVGRGNVDEAAWTR